jgi:hypothetical protein
MQPVSLGSQDVYAQQYYPPPQKGYDDKSYGGGDSYYSNSYDSNRYDSSSSSSSYNSYDDDSYDKKKNIAQIEKEDNKLFICDNGIVVDDRINCPQKCPFNTPLEGVYVMDLDVCLTQPGVGVTCPLDTDLPGVVVTDEANCNIFETCDASSTPLGVALGQDVKVADSALCQLSNVPNLQICEDGPFEGFAVNDQDACDTLDNVQICSLTSDLPGVLTTDPATCNIFQTCDLNTPLGASLGTNVEVVDQDICQLQFAVCDSDSGLARALGLTGTIVVADEQLCELEVTSGTTTCPAGSDLEGVVVSETQADVICNLDIPDVATCDSDSGLARALGLTGTIQVADEQLCELEVTTGTTTCPAGSDLEGVVVLEEQASVVCNLNIPELFTCPAGSDIAGAQVTDLLICDLTSVELFTCPPDSNMGGAVVTDVALCQAPDDDNKCPIGSDLENVYVMNPDTDCDIFEECVAGDPIFSALPAGSAPFEVVDETICQLDVPEEIALFTCSAESNLGAGAVVTDSQLCNAATPAEQCPAGTQLEGVWVVEATDENCSVEGLTLLECPLGTNLEGAIVTDAALCDLTNIELEECPAGTENAGALTTDLDFCDAPGDANICGPTTDLAGVYVANTATDCNIFEECVAGDPIFTALPPGSSDFEVVDETICQLEVPEEVDLFTCPAGTNLAGAVVTDLEICDAAAPAEQCPAGSDLAGVWVVDADAVGACDVEGITTFTCPADSLIPGAIVTDLELCDLVTQEFKGCNTCILFGIGGVDGAQATALIAGINAFVNATTGTQGAEALCESTDITNEMSTIINATTSGANELAANALFKSCIANVEANAALDALSVGGFSTINSNAQIQTSSMTQSSQEQKVTNQNLEVNKSIEQPKQTSVLPLWGFNRQ